MFLFKRIKYFSHSGYNIIYITVCFYLNCSVFNFDWIDYNIYITVCFYLNIDYHNSGTGLALFTLQYVSI